MYEALIALVLCSLNPSTDKADLLTVGLLAIPMGLVQIVAHEHAHGATAQLMCKDCTVEYTYFKNGAVGQAVVDWPGWTDRQALIVSLAPRVVDVAEILATTLLLRIHGMPTWICSVLWTVRAAAYWDLLFNSIGVLHAPTQVDAWAPKIYGGMSNGATRAVTLTSLALITIPIVF